MKLKKLLVLLMVGVILVLTSACDKGKGDADEGITLTWLVPGEEQADTALVLEEANKIIEPAIGAKLNIEFISSSSFSEKLKMSMASGGNFDLCFTSNWLNPFENAATNGGYYDITNMISDELKAVMPDKVWEAAKIKGKLYAVPNNQVMFSRMAVGVRTDLIEKYDFDLSKIKKMDDIEPILEVIKKNEPDLYPYNARHGSKLWFWDKYTNIGIDWICVDNKTNKVFKTYETKEYKYAEAKLRDWYKKGYIRADFASAERDNNVTDVQQGKYAVITNSWKPGMEELLTGVHYTYQPITEARFGTPTAAMTAISATCKYPEKAMELITLMNTNVELYNLICYGIEGKHYTLNEENKIVLNKTSGYKPQGDWKYGNQFNAYLTEGLADDVWTETERMNEEAAVYPISTFRFDDENVDKEYSQVVAVVDEYADSITVKDVAEYERKRNRSLEESGFQKVFEEVKKQVAEHVKNQ